MLDHLMKTSTLPDGFEINIHCLFLGECTDIIASQRGCVFITPGSYM